MMLLLEQYFTLLRHPKNMFTLLELGPGYYYATIFQKPVHVYKVKTSDIYTHKEGAFVGSRTCQLLEYKHVATYLPLQVICMEILQETFGIYVDGESYCKDDICLV